MSIGTPIVFTEGTEKREFKLLSGVTARRDDPNAFDESLLQELIEATPNVLPVREFLPSTTVLFSLGREVPLDLGNRLGRIDNLLVTNDGYPVIVETKLYRNPEGIREVVIQILQYGMAVGKMSLVELEAQIGNGQSPALRRGETISECITRLATDNNCSGLVAEDFETALERHLRLGEILLLIVSDGIHLAVERITDWLNCQGNSTPFKFGLVELKFYTHGAERLVIPRTLLKTKEISRHVVVVDIKPTLDVRANAQVTDEFRNAAGGTEQETRSVKAATVPLTKNELLQQIAPEDQEVAARVLDRIQAYPFDLNGTSSYLQVGLFFPRGSRSFHPLAYLGKGGVWTYPLATLRNLMGHDSLAAFHRDANQFGRFFRDDQLDKPESTGCEVKYRQLQNPEGFAAFLNSYRMKAIELLDAESEA